MQAALQLDAWQEYCRSAALTKRPSLDALRAAVPEFYGLLADTSRRFGVPFDSTAHDASNLEETRVPLQQAINSVLLAAETADRSQKQSHLKTAIQWLESPHPMQATGTKQKIESMLTEVNTCLSDNSALVILASKLKGEE